MRILFASLTFGNHINFFLRSPLHRSNVFDPGPQRKLWGGLCTQETLTKLPRSPGIHKITSQNLLNHAPSFLFCYHERLVIIYLPRTVDRLAYVIQIIGLLEGHQKPCHSHSRRQRREVERECYQSRLFHRLVLSIRQGSRVPHICCSEWWLFWNDWNHKISEIWESDCLQIWKRWILVQWCISNWW